MPADGDSFELPDPSPTVATSLVRTSRRVHQAAAALFLVLGSYVAIRSPGLGLYDGRGPGAGLFPFGVGLLMAALAAVWLVQLVRCRPVSLNGPFFETVQGMRRVAILGAGIVAVGVLLPILGFQLTTFLFVLGLLTFYGRHNLLLAMAIAAGASFGLFTVFTGTLDVSLPVSNIQFLVSLGL